MKIFNNVLKKHLLFNKVRIFFFFFKLVLFGGELVAPFLPFCPQFEKLRLFSDQKELVATFYDSSVYDSSSYELSV